MNFNRIHALFGESNEADVFYSKIDVFTSNFADKYVAFCKAYHRVPEYCVTYVKELLEERFKSYDFMLKLENDSGFDSESLFEPVEFGGKC